MKIASLRILSLLALSLFMLSACASYPGTETGARQSSSQLALESLTRAEVERLLVRGRTMQHQVIQWFGRPQGMSESAGFQYWNYTAAYYDERAGRSGLISLTVVFDQNRLVADYDFQENRYTQQ